jgi:hypothetical protein
MAYRPRMSWRLGVDVAAPSELAWHELVDLSCWPQWGPPVRSARLDDGAGRLHVGATGSVQTTLGFWLPFEVDDWREDARRSSWSWRVAGVPATGHSVVTQGPSLCRVEMTVPWWAPAYHGVVALALTRLRRRAEEKARG